MEQSLTEPTPDDAADIPAPASPDDGAIPTCRPITPEYFRRFVNLSAEGCEQVVDIDADGFIGLEPEHRNRLARDMPLEVFGILFRRDDIHSGDYLPMDVRTEILAYVCGFDAETCLQEIRCADKYLMGGALPDLPEFEYATYRSQVSYWELAVLSPQKLAGYARFLAKGMPHRKAYKQITGREALVPSIH